MRAADVMTTNVITVTPNTTVRALAALFSERGISGAPVVDEAGGLVGVVSEGDLLHRAETGPRAVQNGDASDGSIPSHRIKSLPAIT